MIPSARRLAQLVDEAVSLGTAAAVRRLFALACRGLIGYFLLKGYFHLGTPIIVGMMNAFEA